MPTRGQVRALLGQGLDYQQAGSRLGIPAGQVYLIATGVPADGSDTIPDYEMAGRDDLLPVSQQLANPRHHNPTGKESTRAWMKARVAADNQMRAAARRRTAEPPKVDDPDGAHDAISVLVRQHNQVRYLLQQLQALPSHTTGGSPDHISARKSIVDMVTVRLSQHETIEEEHFWPAVRRALPDGDQLADTALEQEQEGKGSLTELGRKDADSRDFDEHVEQFVRQVRKHVAFEELVFLKMREAMSSADLDRLGQNLLSAAKRAPARPHRRAPKSPGTAVRAAAAGAATMDKARDAADHRPAKRRGKPEEPNVRGEGA
jgi:hemerythrin-like domain-containing protein